MLQLASNGLKSDVREQMLLNPRNDPVTCKMIPSAGHRTIPAIALRPARLSSWDENPAEGLKQPWLPVLCRQSEQALFPRERMQGRFA